VVLVTLRLLLQDFALFHVLIFEIDKLSEYVIVNFCFKLLR
jgi:hypothetical protein